MEYVLVGFNEGSGFRQFSFDCVGEDHSRRTVVVRADTTLARKHQIRLQELPLLCRRLLEEAAAGGLQNALTLTEDHMIAIQTAARTVAERKPHKAPRPSPTAGQAWRNKQI